MRGPSLEFLPNSITPDFAVNRGYISGFISAEKKKTILNAYGKAVKERLLQNKPYGIIYENNGMKTRPIYNVIVKQAKRKDGRILNLPNVTYDKHFLAPTLKLRIESTSVVGLKIHGRLIKEALRAVPVNERYKFPKE